MTPRLNHVTRPPKPAPAPLPGQTPPDDAPARQGPDGLAKAFASRTRAVEGGHREWTGRPASGGGHFQHQGRAYTAYQAAFILRTGREPVGTVSPACDRPRCCDPAHVDDQAARQRDRAALSAVKGMSHRSPSCEHDQDVHGRHRADGKRYCNACNNPRPEPSCGHGNPRCGARPTRLYPCGHRCEAHQPARTRPYYSAA